MKVKELIDMLDGFDPQCKVVAGDATDNCGVTGVRYTDDGKDVLICDRRKKNE